MNPLSAGKSAPIEPRGESSETPPAHSVMVGLRDLRLSYGERRALDDISFQVGKGERFALLGPNGSGKSTLLRILSTLLRPTSGTAKVLGLDAQKDSSQVRRQVGYIPGAPVLYGNLTGREFLTYAAHLRGGLDSAHLVPVLRRQDR